MSLSTADYIVVGIYIAVVLYAGFFLSEGRKKQGADQAEDFLLAGRRLTLPFFVATLVATWYGSILGIGEFVYGQGIVAWVSWGLPYYIAAGIFAWFIAGRIRAAEVHTIPGHIGKKFGRSAGFFASILILVITVPAAYTLMLGVLVQILTGWPLWISVITASVITLAYVYTGGFRADVYANAAQFVFMYLGFGILLFFTLKSYGSPGTMLEELPHSHTNVLGGNSWQYVAAWFIVALQTFIDPSFHQRCSAAATPATAQRGIFLSILCWAVFDLLTVTTGLYARAFLPNLDQPLMSYPALAEAVLPVVWKGLFLVALLATVMSTLDSYALISGMTIGNDILLPLGRRFRRKDYPVKSLTRIGLVVSACIAITFAIAIPSAIDLIYRAASIAVPGLLLPMCIAYSRTFSFRANSTLFIMFASAGTSLLWMILSATGARITWIALSSVEPMMPGIFLSVILTFIFLRRTTLDTAGK